MHMERQTKNMKDLDIPEFIPADGSSQAYLNPGTILEFEAFVEGTVVPFILNFRLEKQSFCFCAWSFVENDEYRTKILPKLCEKYPRTTRAFWDARILDAIDQESNDGVHCRTIVTIRQFAVAKSNAELIDELVLLKMRRTTCNVEMVTFALQVVSFVITCDAMCEVMHAQNWYGDITFLSAIPVRAAMRSKSGLEIVKALLVDLINGTEMQSGRMMFSERLSVKHRIRLFNTLLWIYHESAESVRALENLANTLFLAAHKKEDMTLLYSLWLWSAVEVVPYLEAARLLSGRDSMRNACAATSPTSQSSAANLKRLKLRQKLIERRAAEEGHQKRDILDLMVVCMLDSQKSAPPHVEFAAYCRSSYRYFYIDSYLEPAWWAQAAARLPEQKRRMCLRCFIQLMSLASGSQQQPFMNKNVSQPESSSGASRVDTRYMTDMTDMTDMVDVKGVDMRDMRDTRDMMDMMDMSSTVNALDTVLEAIDYAPANRLNRWILWDWVSIIESVMCHMDDTPLPARMQIAEVVAKHYHKTSYTDELVVNMNLRSEYIRSFLSHCMSLRKMFPEMYYGHESSEEYGALADVPCPSSIVDDSVLILASRLFSSGVRMDDGTHKLLMTFYRDNWLVLMSWLAKSISILEERVAADDGVAEKQLFYDNIAALVKMSLDILRQRFPTYCRLVCVIAWIAFDVEYTTLTLIMKYLYGEGRLEFTDTELLFMITCATDLTCPLNIPIQSRMAVLCILESIMPCSSNEDNGAIDSIIGQLKQLLLARADMEASVAEAPPAEVYERKQNCNKESVCSAP